MLTQWGYEVEGDEIQSLMTVAEFRAIYPTMSSTDSQIQAVLDSVSAAVRDFCGWHVAPSLDCTYTGRGYGQLLMLPSMSVEAVNSLTVSGNEVTDYEWTDAGMVKLLGRCFPDRWRSVVCEYTAGVASASIAQVAAQIAANSLAAAPGVSSERAGDVSITYNATGSGITGGVSLLPRDYALLYPYRLARAW